MSDTTSSKFLYVAKAVLRSPSSIGIIVLGLGATAIAGDLWWLPFGAMVVGWCAVLFNRLHNEEYLQKLFAERQARENHLSDEQIESALDGMDFETRQRIRYIVQLQSEISRETEADDVADYARRDLQRLSAQLSPVVRRAIRIGQRKQQLVKYLHNVDERSLSNYCANLQQRIDATQDPVARSQYQQALKAREAELQTYQAIGQAAARIDSQLESVEATFASWKAKVIRIKTVDVAGASTVAQGLDQELRMLNSDIDVLEGSVTEALAAEDQAIVGQVQ
jgi:hypothetical protein